MNAAASSASISRIWRHWRVLCEKIGERRAGSAGEGAAADYILGQFKRLKLASTGLETFPCVSLRAGSAVFQAAGGAKFKNIPARVLVGSTATPGSAGVEGELVWVEMPEQAERSFRQTLRGKILMLFGPLPMQEELHRRMVAARPLAVVHVDDRLPFDWLKDDGVYPAWVKRHGMPPIVTIPYQSAWEMKKRGCRRARLKVSVKQTTGLSQNVWGELPGRRPKLPPILLTAHHDTQCNNTGADDNASGVVAVLELAVRLSKRKWNRTIRFVSFGVEEQLSVGAARYVRDHKEELRKMGMVFNFDAIASPLGHFQLFRAGSDEFGACLTGGLARHSLDVVERTDVSPFGDGFPFSAFGVPMATLYRSNMDSGMRWQHHSGRDNLEEVSAQELERVVQAVGGLIGALANETRWPFRRGLPAAQRARTRQLFEEMYEQPGE